MFRCLGCGRDVNMSSWKRRSRLCDDCLDESSQIWSKKRKHRRLYVGRDVEYTLSRRIEARQHIDTSTKNISAIGLCIIAFEKLETGDKLDLKFSIPRFIPLKPRARRVITAKGKVVWIDALKISGHNIENTYEMGVELTDIRQDDQEKIKKYVESKLKQPKRIGRSHEK